ITKSGCIGDTVVLPVLIDYVLRTPPINGDTSLCEFTKGVVYTVIHSNGSTYDWKISGGTIISGQGQSKIIIDWDKAGTGGLQVTETAHDSVNNIPCIGIPVLLKVTINPVPQTSGVSGPEELCEQAWVTYRVNGFNGSTYDWNVSGTATLISDSSDSVQVFFTENGNYTLSVQEISRDSCPGEVITLDIIVYPNPETSGISGLDTVCTTILKGNIYSVKGFSTSNYTWAVEKGVLVSGQGTNEIVVDWISSGFGMVKVVETSDFGCTGDTQYLPINIDSPYVSISLVTTSRADDKQIEIHWVLYNGHNYKKHFRIMRKTPGQNFWQLLDTVPLDQRVFIDRTAQTSRLSYLYTVEIGDLCNQTIQAPPHRSILANLNVSEDSLMTLEWNNYEGWPVLQYVVYRSLDFDTTMVPYGTTAGLDFETIDDLSSFRQCYRIAAINSEDNTIVSWSNKVCADFAPIVWVPNAFTPNSFDEINNSFRIVAHRFRSFELLIYNRWGEEIFTSTSPDNQWDGTFRGKDCEEGVYLYILHVQGLRDHQFLDGTLHLYR
ncbi:MAG: gliding motility-associated C-terminal domain-containing protein, partial [Bacteroidota bacterium]|nr:gliding motility-associated C-terminal domain-containing protein [Bacteroidota bacterium]